MWAVILDLANGDPLRAMEMEDRLSREWFDNAMMYRGEIAKLQKEKNA